MYDLLIKNATIIDGTGAPGFKASVAVKDAKIVMNPDESKGAKEIIDAKGLVLSPGFIDAHCHDDETIGNNATNLAKTSQGVTTVSGGNCGESLVPVPTDPANLELSKQFFASYLKAEDCDYKDKFETFTSMKNYRKFLDTRKCTVNYSMFTGHISIRNAVMGFANREATKEEIEKMKALLRETMENGSRGLSAGLIYAPSCYASKEEMIELCKVVAEYDGFFAVHLRNEAETFVEAVQEAIDIAKGAGCRLNLSHHKVCGAENWGMTKKTLQMIKDAQKEGLKVHTDVYPWTATGNYLNICMPKEFFDKGPDMMCELLKDPKVRAELKAQIPVIDGRFKNCGGFDHIKICGAPETPEAEGKFVSEYAKEVGRDVFEVYFDICQANGHRAQAAYFAMSEEDLERVLLDENSVICTDSYDISVNNAVHPRCFGTFPLCLGYYVREKKLMSLEKMIHKMTQAPAQFLCYVNKGVIADGYDADLVLFNPDTVGAKADYSNPRELSDGIEQVFVAGECVYKDKKLTGNCPGKFLSYK